MSYSLHHQPRNSAEAATSSTSVVKSASILPHSLSPVSLKRTRPGDAGQRQGGAQTQRIPANVESVQWPLLTLKLRLCSNSRLKTEKQESDGRTRALSRRFRFSGDIAPSMCTAFLYYSVSDMRVQSPSPRLLIYSTYAVYSGSDWGGGHTERVTPS